MSRKLLYIGTYLMKLDNGNYMNERRNQKLNNYSDSLANYFYYEITTELFINGIQRF